MMSETNYGKTKKMLNCDKTEIEWRNKCYEKSKEDVYLKPVFIKDNKTSNKNM